MSELEPDPERAAKLSGVMRLTNVGCMTVGGRLIDSTITAEALQWNVAPVRLRWAALKAGTLLAIVPFRLNVFEAPPHAEGEPPKSGKSVATIAVTFRVEYEPAEADYDRQDALHFLGVLGFLHAWPYFRADVQTLTTKIGLPALTLPVKVSGDAAAMVRVETEPVVNESDAPLLDVPPAADSQV